MVKDGCKVEDFKDSGVYLYKPGAGLPKIKFIQPTADAVSRTNRKDYTLSALQLSAAYEYHEQITGIVSSCCRWRLTHQHADPLQQSCESGFLQPHDQATKTSFDCAGYELREEQGSADEAVHQNEATGRQHCREDQVPNLCQDCV